MKIVSVLGSPRKKGNSSSIAQAFTDKAEALGAKVKTYYLNGMNFRGCQACMACKQKLDHCVLKDDLTEPLEAIHEADVLVMASPVYYFDISGQLKCFIDRTFSYLHPDYFSREDPCRLPSGKKGLLVLSQGDVSERHLDVPEKYEHYMDFYGIKEKRTIRAVGVIESSTAEETREHREQAEALALEWCGQ